MALPEAAGAAVLGAAGIGAATGLANAGISSANNHAYTNARSWGDSSSYGYTSAANAANAYDFSVAKTYGDLATEWDRVNAERANAVQEAFMQKQMLFNAAEAAKTRDWETYMSNTSYQRAIKDLIAAGLNPILAAGNMGATTPSGATASSGLAAAHKANSYANSESYGSGTSSSWGSSGGENWSNSTEGSNSNSRSWGSSQSNPAYMGLVSTAQQLAATINRLSKNEPHAQVPNQQHNNQPIHGNTSLGNALGTNGLVPTGKKKK